MSIFDPAAQIIQLTITVFEWLLKLTKKEIVKGIIEIALYVLIAILVVMASILIGPFIFVCCGYNVIEPKIITASDSISYLLQAILAVAIGFIAVLSQKKMD